MCARPAGRAEVLISVTLILYVSLTNAVKVSPPDSWSLAPRGDGLVKAVGAVDVSLSERLIVVTLKGRPASDSIVRMLEDVNVLIEANPSLRVLIDENDLRPNFVGPGDIVRFVRVWRQGKALRATLLAVFVSNTAMYGLNRMFQGLSGAEGSVRVFHDRAEATALARGRADRRELAALDVSSRCCQEPTARGGLR